MLLNRLNLSLASSSSHILDPGFSTSLTMWVIPALKPTKAVKCGGRVGSSLGKDFILPL